MMSDALILGIISSVVTTLGTAASFVAAMNSKSSVKRSVVNGEKIDVVSKQVDGNLTDIKDDLRQARELILTLTAKVSRKEGMLEALNEDR